MPRPASAGELRRVLELERHGNPFLLVRDPKSDLRLTPLDRTLITVGRSTGNLLALPWDEAVSRVHAELRHTGGVWVIVDGGLSTNGTFLNEKPVSGSARLADGDLLRFGQTLVIFRDPRESSAASTTQTAQDASLTAPDITPAQSRILAALCGPLLGEGARPLTPATNQEIGEKLFLSVDAVKGHLRVLFQKFGIAELPQNQKRVALAERAIQSGAAFSSRPD